MAPKQQITREQILIAAYEITRENGIEAVNARSVAKWLQCSTQPIFSQFANMEQLRNSTHDYAIKRLEEEVLQAKDEVDIIQSGYLKVINLARQERNLFVLIYLSRYCLGKNFMETRMGYESNQRILEELEKRTGLGKEACLDILQRMSILVQGMATVIATTDMVYSDDQVIQMAETTLQDMIGGYKERGK